MNVTSAQPKVGSPTASGRVERPRRRRRLPRGLAFTFPLLVVLVIGFNLPLAGVLVRSFGGSANPTLEFYRELAVNPAYLKVVANTFRIAMIVTASSVVIGYPLALWISRLGQFGRALGITLVILPFWTSILVRTYAWIIILGFRGIVNESLLRLGLVGSPLQLIFNDLGVTIGMIHVLLPFIVLPLTASMLRFDERLLRAGASLGAPPLTVFWRIYFPLTVPALASGAILVFILSIGFFVTPALLGGGQVSMIATVLDTFINRLPRWELASALSMIVLVVALGFYSAYRRVGRILD